MQKHYRFFIRETIHTMQECGSWIHVVPIVYRLYIVFVYMYICMCIMVIIKEENTMKARTLSAGDGNKTYLFLKTLFKSKMIINLDKFFWYKFFQILVKKKRHLWEDKVLHVLT